MTFQPTLSVGAVMPKLSAGILLYRACGDDVEVLLVHPGGPFFRNKDDGSWTVPKGEPADGEDLLDAARREFREEIGFLPEGPFVELPPVKQRGGKTVYAWACRGDCDPAAVRSNTFEIEWPPKSGRRATFPEIDRAEFFPLATARTKINPAQIDLLNALATRIATDAEEKKKEH
jgi:predicted NUDIX family NTP pyrophosphohydrolase